MGEKIRLDRERNIVLLYKKDKQIWEDKTSSILSLFTAYYHDHFTGYDIYFRDARSKFFYNKENVLILKLVKNIPINKLDVIVNGNIIDATKVDQFEEGYYRITTSSKSIISKNLKLESGKYRDIYSYYIELAEYAESITSDDEPLYFLARNYKRIKPSNESILNEYLKGRYSKNQDIDLLIVPFDFNQSQYRAIETALTHSISVIEGPPGTGKTQTILNLISNIISRNKNCAVVSNNNTAIDNIHEKLSEEGLSFISASLGKLDNVTRFFEENNDDDLRGFLELPSSFVNKNTAQKINDLSALMRKIHEDEIKIAKLQSELNEVLTEQKNQNSQIDTSVKIRENLSSNDYLSFIRRLEQSKKIRFTERWILDLKYRIKLKKIDTNALLSRLETLFYIRRIKEINYRIDALNLELSKHQKNDVINQLKEISKNFLLDRIKKHYLSFEITKFDKDSYKQDYTNFLKRYPVVLSTSQSLLNNAPKGFLFDYLIIDEASQGDLLSSVIAMSCARKLVVVGDSRQLQQIDEERLFEKSRSLAMKYDIFSSYHYESNSVLRSVRQSINNIPTTLLREHYRCAPDIINFCNKMFYDNELIPMTINTNQHIEIIKTVPGNHARKNPNGTGMYNQREIDELEILLQNKETSKIGVITPFRYQAQLIQEAYKKSQLEADTIHKFQGRQKDEIVLSFVVNSLDKNPDQIENKLYDFITDEKLLNVAISRGKNKVTAIVSDKIYKSENNIIHDFIRYTEYLYGNSITKESSITSVFDYLYSEYSEILVNKFKTNPKKHITELLMCEMIDNLLKSHKKIGYTMHIRLSKIIRNVDTFNYDERRYLLHPWTHVDFLFYNKVSKERLFVLEVDGIQYHEQNKKQSFHDEIKDRALKMNGVTIYRFRTNESNEKQKLLEILDKLV